jgi:uncharacterized membrane protein YeiH
MLKVPLAVELSAVIVGALSGATHAAERKADVVGTFVLALSTGVGGGLLRDILIRGGPPVALVSPYYLPVVAAAALVAVVFTGSVTRLTRSLIVVDALLLGLWTVMGTEQALAHQLPVTSAVFVGTLTAVGGGAMRDILTGQTPAILLRGELHATAAFAGAVVYTLIRAADLPRWVAELATVGVAASLRLAARRWHITAPTPAEISERLRRVRARRPSGPAPPMAGGTRWRRDDAAP